MLNGDLISAYENVLKDAVDAINAIISMISLFVFVFVFIRVRSAKCGNDALRA
jgi:hypothetical protein